MDKRRLSFVMFIVLSGLGFVLFLGRGVPATAQGVLLRPVVRYPVKYDVSPALRDLGSALASNAWEGGAREVPFHRLPRFSPSSQVPEGNLADPVIQNRSSVLTMPALGMNFEGVNNRNGVFPPDTQGDIGFDPATGKKLYVQWVNLSYAIWDVTITPTLVFGPVNGNALWGGLGGDCEFSNNGDPITLYDSLAHRWFMSQFAWSDSVHGPFSQCIAVSQTSDPLGQWNRYVYSFTVMNDYAKFGVWPDGYYMTINQFTNATATGAWAGAGVAAFERDKMLAGQMARIVYLDLYTVDSNFGGMLPADLDGLRPPPAGAPGYFVQVDDSSSIGPVDAMRLWRFHVNWTNIASSTFGLNGQPNATLAVAAFNPLPCSSNCIPQPGTSTRLDAISDRVMYRLAYRNYGDHESLVTNHTVNAGGGRAGVRWYEVRDPGSSPVIYQQGTFAPDDGVHRWMGSVAMDHTGNMALGYSVSSESVYPSIRYSGRLANDPLGQMAQGEGVVITGTGAQLHSAGRWGDYSMLTIDPVDDCTFWYTNEYIQTTGPANWQTRIAAWRFPACATSDYGLVIQPSLSKQAEPGSAATFTLRVMNVGTKTDTYTVALSGNVWPTTAPQALGPLNAGQHADMLVTVSVPLTLTRAMTDSATIVLTSHGDSTQSASTTLTTSARFSYFLLVFLSNWLAP